MGQIFRKQTVHDLPDRQSVSVCKQIQNIEMKNNIVVRKTSGFEGIVQRIVRHVTVSYRNEDVLSGLILPKADIVPKPAFNSAPFIIIQHWTY